MSKSLGNHIPINDFIEKWDPEVLRLSYLSNHYSSNVDFSDRLFQVSRRRLYYYYQALNLLDKKLSTEDKQNIKPEAAVKEIEDFKERFHKSMCDDFNTALAIGEFNKFFHFTYKNLSTVNLSEALALALSTCIREIGEVFKILQKDPKSFIRENTKMILQDLQITEDEINHKLKLRNQARKNKDWQSSDRIRDELLGRGILLQDTKDGTEWIVKGLLA
jgi:cysteinyl-tRNA synthetase